MEYPRQYHERERLIQGKIGSDVGQQWLIDLSKLDIQVCLNGQLWVKAFVKSSEDIGLRVISKYFHIFEPPAEAGMTAYVLLDSSHFSVHTFANRGEAAVDLFACTNHNLFHVFEKIREILDIKKENIRMVKTTTRFTRNIMRTSNLYSGLKDFEKP